uniref:Uncharacterized protein n=1 Tax=Leersia perrieri TaxID=77586 RepID=A0A0D9WRG9_9ORYZ
MPSPGTLWLSGRRGGRTCRRTTRTPSSVAIPALRMTTTATETLTSSPPALIWHWTTLTLIWSM